MAIAERSGLDFVDLQAFDVDMRAAGMVGRSAAQRYHMVPIAFAPDGALIVAAEDAFDSLGVSDIELMTKTEVRRAIAPSGEIRALIERLPERSPTTPPPAAEVPSDSAPTDERLEQEAAVSEQDPPAAEAPETTVPPPPVSLEVAPPPTPPVEEVTVESSPPPPLEEPLEPEPIAPVEIQPPTLPPAAEVEEGVERVEVDDDASESFGPPDSESPAPPEPPAEETAAAFSPPPQPVEVVAPEPVAPEPVAAADPELSDLSVELQSLLETARRAESMASTLGGRIEALEGADSRAQTLEREQREAAERVAELERELAESQSMIAEMEQRLASVTGVTERLKTTNDVLRGLERILEETAL
jgi:hypothetical protein